MTRGSRICLFSNLRSSLLAARVSRRRWTRTSSTTPVWSTLATTSAVPGDFRAQPHRDAICRQLAAGGDGSVGETLAEFEYPLPHRFMADDDAAGSQQLLDHAQPEGNTKYSQTAWPMISAGNRYPVWRASGGHHPTRLLTPIRRRKRRRSAKLTVPRARRLGPAEPRREVREQDSRCRLSQGQPGIADTAGICTCKFRSMSLLALH
jgi:hypothetical protein